MTSHELPSGYRPVGEPTVTHENPWYKVKNQPMDFVDPHTGNVKKAAAEGGQMNYVDMKPGVGVVAELSDGSGTLLIPQERYVTNLVEGQPVRHYEVPAGGIEVADLAKGQDGVINTARREFGEEAGYDADDFIVLGPAHRGLLTQAGMSTHHNYTVLARGLRPSAHGPLHETTEILGKHEKVTWDDAEEMYLNPEGLWTPKGPKIISSMGTVASLALARAYLARQEALGPKYIDLKKKTS
jgi:8-oxo-dGTP pyrophosphatase MutT (NUDIX family)